MAQREEWVVLTQHTEANVRALCRRFGVYPATAHRWLLRSRHPRRSPAPTPATVEQRILDLGESPE